MFKVLVIATSRKTRGGITSVVKAHEKGEQWKNFRCKWIETHIDRGVIAKLGYIIKGWFQFIILLPFCKIVHIHMSEPPSAFRKCLFLPFAKLWGKKVIIHFHAFSTETTINGKYRWVYQYLFGHADRVIVLSEYWKKAVTSTFYLGNKVQVIYNPCTAEVSSEKYTKKNHILYAGTLNSRKGYSDMIRAFDKIAMKFPDWKIVFAGNGEIELGKLLARKLGIEKQNVFLGWVNGDAKDKAFKEASIFCLPSYAEGFPMSVLDAWAYRLPVITTPVGGISDIAKDGENLLLFNPGDVDVLAIQMDKMINDVFLRNAISKKSEELAATTFSLMTMNKEVGKLYNELLSL